MTLSEMVGVARDAVSARRVFADPVDTGGVTVIPAARVSGGGGGGQGHDENGQQGEGGGLGLGARPVGAYVVAGGQVRWRPAVDVNRLFAVLGAVAVAYLAARAARPPGRPARDARR